MVAFVSGALLVSAVTAAPAQAESARVNASALRLRQKPSLGSKIIGKVLRGKTVTVLNRSRSSVWWKVRAQGKVGYMWSSYLRLLKPAPASTKKKSLSNNRGLGNKSRTARRSSATRGGSTTKRASSSRKTSSSKVSESAVGKGRFASKTRKSLSGLKPAFRKKVENVLRKMRALGWQPVAWEGYRTRAQQAEKVRKGYSKTMNSNHRWGIAVDIVDARYRWSGKASNKNFKFWIDLGKTADAEGLGWGGHWRMRDVAHVQQPKIKRRPYKR